MTKKKVREKKEQKQTDRQIDGERKRERRARFLFLVLLLYNIIINKNVYVKKDKTIVYKKLKPPHGNSKMFVDSLSNKLKTEFEIYKNTITNKDNKNVGIPQIYNFIQTPDYNIMIMELMGPCLESMFEEYDKQFKLTTDFNVKSYLLVTEFRRN